jgi:hypothetical protein
MNVLRERQIERVEVYRTSTFRRLAMGGMTCPTGGAAPCVIHQLSVKPTREDCEPEPIDATPQSAPAMFDRVVGQYGLAVVDEFRWFCEQRRFLEQTRSAHEGPACLRSAPIFGRTDTTIGSNMGTSA